MTLAHIGGLPVEETLMMVVPAAGIWASLALYEVRRRLPRGRRAQRCGGGPRLRRRPIGGAGRDVQAPRG